MELPMQGAPTAPTSSRKRAMWRRRRPRPSTARERGDRRLPADLGLAAELAAMQQHDRPSRPGLQAARLRADAERGALVAREV